MTVAPEKQERTVGWALAAMVLIHLFVVRLQMPVALTTFAILITGAVLRERGAFVPRWLGYASLLLGGIAVVLAQGSWRPIPIAGGMGAILSALLLLRPVTPARGQWIVFFLILMLISAILSPYPTAGMTFIILDVAALLILTEQMHRPPEMAVSFWVSVVRSLRVIVPVGIVVTGIFWLFPNLTVYTPPVFAGFSGSSVLNPGSIAEVVRSRRVALTARFAKDQPVPAPQSLYWRGQVLEINDGLSWSRAGRRFNRQSTLQSTPPSEGGNTLKYSQDLTSNLGSIVPVLDHAVFVEAKRNGEDIAAPEIGGGVLTAVGAGPITLTAFSSLEAMSDPPHPEIAESARAVPKKISENPALQKVAAEIFPAVPNTTAVKLRALGAYFRNGGFRYTSRPGRIRDLSDFLNQRRGFCEHYATASATLLRLGGVPSRVVTGYRGGEWSPWMRTITVRDSNAHAWVEAWDEPSRQWLRFDPTNLVAPELLAGLEAEMDSTKWPWYRLAWSYGQAVATSAAQRIDALWTRVTSSDYWENANVYLFGTLVMVGLFWLIRNRVRQQAEKPHEMATRLLAELEHRAPRYHRARHPGETPLAWLGRLEDRTPEQPEKEILRETAALYEACVYKPEDAGTPPIPSLQLAVKRLINTWKGRGAP